MRGRPMNQNRMMNWKIIMKATYRSWNTRYRPVVMNGPTSSQRGMMTKMAASATTATMNSVRSSMPTRPRARSILRSSSSCSSTPRLISSIRSELIPTPYTRALLNLCDFAIAVERKHIRLIVNIGSRLLADADQIELVAGAVWQRLAANVRGLLELHTPLLGGVHLALQ